jgi:hypothetical protein
MQLEPRKRTIVTNTSLIFLFLTIELFGCLHKHVDVFLHDYATAIWSLKGPEGLHLSTLVIFLCQKISITLQRMQASFILNWAVTIGLTTSQLPPFQNTPPITIVDLL